MTFALIYLLIFFVWYTLGNSIAFIKDWWSRLQVDYYCFPIMILLKPTTRRLHDTPRAFHAYTFMIALLCSHLVQINFVSYGHHPIPTMNAMSSDDDGESYCIHQFSAEWSRCYKMTKTLPLTSQMQ